MLKKMKNAYIILFLIGFIGVGCLIAFNLIGATIADNGFLHEPFFLLPTGYLLMIIGFGGVGITPVVQWFCNRRQLKNHKQNEKII